MWLFEGFWCFIFLRGRVLWLKLHIGIYSIHWKVFDLLFEISTKTMTSRDYFFFPPLFKTSNYSFKSECEAQMKAELPSEKCFWAVMLQ